MDRNVKAVKDAITFLKRQPKKPKILVKQIRNLGDTLHLTPVIHHYRLKFPSAAIAFIVGQWYHNIHEHNPHIDRLFLADHNASPQDRLRLWPRIMKCNDIDIKVVASIFPFGEVHPRNKWCHHNIADQYFHNSGIKDRKPLGGRQLIAKITDEDRAFANNLAEKCLGNKLVVFEYVSYSNAPVWGANKFSHLAQLLKREGITCVTIAAAHEGLIKGTVDCRGTTWRQATAVLSKSIAMVGVGSGITMLAAAAAPQPRIIELSIPSSVSMNGCGYAPSISLHNPDVRAVAHKILEVAK